jgi:hypothetical protein
VDAKDVNETLHDETETPVSRDETRSIHSKHRLDTETFDTESISLDLVGGAPIFELSRRRVDRDDDVSKNPSPLKMV